MAEPMSDARIEHVSACLSASCDAGLAETFARELLAEVKQLRAERKGEIGPRCRALTNTRLNLQCDRVEGHDAAHVVELAGMGRISWHGAAPPQPEDGDRG